MIVYVFIRSLTRNFESLLMLPTHANATNFSCSHAIWALHQISTHPLLDIMYSRNPNKEWNQPSIESVFWKGTPLSMPWTHNPSRMSMSTMSTHLPTSKPLTKLTFFKETSFIHLLKVLNFGKTLCDWTYNS